MCQAPCWGPYNAFQSPLMCTQTWPCPGSPVTLMSVCLSNGHFSLLDSFNLSVIVKPPDHCLQVKSPPFLFSVILCSSRVVSPIWVLLSPFLCWHIPHPPNPCHVYDGVPQAMPLVSSNSQFSPKMTFPMPVASSRMSFFGPSRPEFPLCSLKVASDSAFSKLNSYLPSQSWPLAQFSFSRFFHLHEPETWRPSLVSSTLIQLVTKSLQISPPNYF